MSFISNSTPLLRQLNFGVNAVLKEKYSHAASAGGEKLSQQTTTCFSGPFVYRLFICNNIKVDDYLR